MQPISYLKDFNEALGLFVNLGTVGHWIYLLTITLFFSGVGAVSQQILTIPMSQLAAVTPAGQTVTIPYRRSLWDHVRNYMIHVIIKPHVPLGKDFFYALTLFVVIVLIDFVGVPYWYSHMTRAYQDLSQGSLQVPQITKLHSLLMDVVVPLAVAALNVAYMGMIAFMAARITWKLRNLS